MALYYQPIHVEVDVYITSWLLLRLSRTTFLAGVSNLISSKAYIMIIKHCEYTFTPTHYFTKWLFLFLLPLQVPLSLQAQSTPNMYLDVWISIHQTPNLKKICHFRIISDGTAPKIQLHLLSPYTFTLRIYLTDIWALYPEIPSPVMLVPHLDIQIRVFCSSL